ncbi:MAG: PAC2 family protein [Candidatus Nanoarchaeia archaeon]|nr:PAC2 family protein [Candidatus Nanoarchaeia archaeon]MDD5239580.1 PAC2 family protein [Candidatus Nanoarchaeia archaeon]
MADKIEIKMNGAIPKNAIIFEGFQGIGLVATLAAQYIADSTNARVIGHISSSSFPPMALLVKGEIKNPMVVYHFKRNGQNYLIFESELPIPHKLINDLAESIAEFAKKNKAKQIVCLEGIATAHPPSESNVFAFATSRVLDKKIGTKIPILQSGIIVGISAALMTHAKVLNVPSICLIAEAHAEFPDGLAAASIVKKVNMLYGLDIDVGDLEKESKKLEDQLMSVIEKAKQVTESETKSPGKVYIG